MTKAKKFKGWTVLALGLLSLSWGVERAGASAGAEVCLRSDGARMSPACRARLRQLDQAQAIRAAADERRRARAGTEPPRHRRGTDAGAVGARRPGSVHR